MCFVKLFNTLGPVLVTQVASITAI